MPDASEADGQPVSFRQALGFWWKLGFISFGGPAGQIALMHRVVVEERRWLSEARFLHALNYCMLLPGPEAQQLATYIGWLMHRTWGGLAAGVLFVAPSLGLMVALGWVYMAFGQLPWVAGLFHGLQSAVAALVLHAVHRIGSKTLRRPSQAPVLWTITWVAFVAVAGFAVPFPAVVAGAAMAGALAARRWPSQFAAASGHKLAGPAAAVPGAAPARRAWLDDDSPAPAHTRFARARLARIVGVCVLLWLLPWAALSFWQGRDATLPTMAWFFTKAAWLTFGGAYAVLPYVMQGAVAQYQWLTAAQMMDGLALGETTPGPLIMVVAFVGFVGGWSQGGAWWPGLVQAPLLGGVLAACVATWFTFLPSFFFIFAGAPVVEATQGRRAWTAPLTGITAAVVGVIASLGLFFLGHLARPDGQALGEVMLGGQRIDAVALGLAAFALWALLRLKWGVVPTLSVCALAGLGLSL